MQQHRNYMPKARADGLIVQPIENELVLYNYQREFVHLLNPTAARVWQQSDGSRTVSEISDRAPELPVSSVHALRPRFRFAALLSRPG